MQLPSGPHDCTVHGLPAGIVLARVTPTFDHHTVPAGLLAAHRVADGTWGRLIVHTGTLTFRFEDDPDHPITVDAGRHVLIPPGRPHHLELDGPVTFAVELYRPAEAPPDDGTPASTGLSAADLDS